jgi:hypothetical protein
MSQGTAEMLGKAAPLTARASYLQPGGSCWSAHDPRRRPLMACSKSKQVNFCVLSLRPRSIHGVEQILTPPQLYPYAHPLLRFPLYERDYARVFAPSDSAASSHESYTISATNQGSRKKCHFVFFWPSSAEGLTSLARHITHHTPVPASAFSMPHLVHT